MNQRPKLTTETNDRNQRPKPTTKTTTKTTTKITTKTNGRTKRQPTIKNGWSMTKIKTNNSKRRHTTKLQINKTVVRLHGWTHQPLTYRSNRRFEQEHGWPTDAVGAEPRMTHGCYAQQNHGCPTDATHSRTTDDPRLLCTAEPRMPHGCALTADHGWPTDAH